MTYILISNSNIHKFYLPFDNNISIKIKYIFIFITNIKVLSCRAGESGGHITNNRPRMI